MNNGKIIFECSSEDNKTIGKLHNLIKDTKCLDELTILLEAYNKLKLLNGEIR